MKKLKKLSELKINSIETAELKKISGGHPQYTYTGFSGLHTDWYGGGQFGYCPGPDNC